MRRVTNSITIRYDIADNDIEKKSLDILLSPSGLSIMNEFAKNDDGLSSGEIESKTGKHESLKYDLEKLIEDGIILLQDNKYMMTDTGKKVYKKMQSVVNHMLPTQ
jgi:predicted transcriptional regulator